MENEYAASGDESAGFVNYLIRQGLADRTIRIYENSVERWLIHCARSDLDPLTATPLELRAYSESLPDTHASRRQHAVALRHWYLYRGADGELTGAIRKPKRRRMKWNGIEEVEGAEALIQTARGVFPEGTATLFGLLMGLRRAEIAAVDWVRFNRELTWYDVLGKGNLEDEIPVHEIVAEEIQGKQTAFRYLFPGRSSGHVNPATVSLWIAEVGDAAGVPELTPHKLRHTFISDVNDRNDLRVAQLMARHASPDTTAGYTRVPKEKMEAASRRLSYAQLRPVVNE